MPLHLRATGANRRATVRIRVTRRRLSLFIQRTSPRPYCPFIATAEDSDESAFFFETKKPTSLYSDVDCVSYFVTGEYARQTKVEFYEGAQSRTNGMQAARLVVP